MSKILDVWGPIAVIWLTGVILGVTVSNHILKNRAIDANVAEWQVDKYGNTKFVWKTPIVEAVQNSK